jgi:two-component system, OmpR family, sensor histidine kinase MtrB
MDVGRVFAVWQSRLRGRLVRLGRYPWGARLLRLLRAVRLRWRRSLQLRVVAATMLLGTLVVFAVGSILLAGIWNGLAQSRLTTAYRQHRQVTDQVANQLDNATYNDANQTLSDTVNFAEAQVASNGGSIVMIRALRSPVTQITFPGRALGGAQISDIPTDLRVAVNAKSRQQGRRFALPVHDGASRATVPAVAVGSIVVTPAGLYELYTVFPLDQETQTLRLVQRTFVIGGVALVVLVGAVALVVTRQVVAPVRQAARTAEELASGLLDRRMRVRGQDDLARLGRAFNEMAASLERQIHRLEELSRVQRRFVSDVSHELRTPLTTIRMASEVIHESRHEFAPATARSAELLQTQLDRFESLLGDLLEISRFDAGAAVLDVEPADLRELVARVVDGLAPLAERRGVALQQLMPDQPCLAEFDSRRVERVVRNLVANAIEHGEGRPVRISIAAAEDAVAVSVLDRGVGLRPGELQMVFNRFWRADPARARTTGGTGLGLAIALEDAHLHGGWLQVWGESGVGANFRLTLPRQAGIALTGSPLPLVPFPDGAAVPAAASGAASHLGPPLEPDLDVTPSGGAGSVVGVGPDGAGAGA